MNQINRSIPVYWGNSTWRFDAYGRIIRGAPIAKGSRYWIDYRYPTVVCTADLRVEGYPSAHLRVQFTDQFLEQQIQQHQHCITNEPIAIITSGGTASGKTAAVDWFLNRYKDESFIRIDYDRMKRALPEYELMIRMKLKSAAEFTHYESCKMAGSLVKRAAKAKMNLIWEHTLAKPEHIDETIRLLRKKNYVVMIAATHVTIPRAQERAVARFHQMGRYVRPDVIVDTHLRCPKKLRELRDLVDAVLLFDNNGDNRRVMLNIQLGEILHVDSTLYQSYLETVGHDHCLMAGLPVRNGATPRAE